MAMEDVYTLSVSVSEYLNSVVTVRRGDVLPVHTGGWSWGVSYVSGGGVDVRVMGDAL